MPDDDHGIWVETESIHGPNPSWINRAVEWLGALFGGRPESDNAPYFACIYCLSSDHDGADCPTKAARRIRNETEEQQ